MPHPTWIFEPLSGGHDREGFSCGNRALDHYLKEQANQDLRRACAVPFVLIPSAGESAVLGYYTLSSFGIDAGGGPSGNNEEASALSPDPWRRSWAVWRLTRGIMGKASVSFS
jgi:hypothetical protein